MKYCRFFVWVMLPLWWGTGRTRAYSKYLRYRYTVQVLDYYRPGTALLLGSAALWPVLYLVFRLWAG